MKNKVLKPICLLIILLLSLTTTGCSSQIDNPLSLSEKPAIVCTAFPQFDWTLNILGDRADEFDVILLNSQGTDMHSFQPTAANMVAVANCDLFIYMGGYSETWVDATLKSSGNDQSLVLPLLEHVDKLEELHSVGILTSALSGETSEDHDHHHHHSHDDVDEHDDPHAGHNHAPGEEVYDEHLWLSLRCAAQACEAILEKICQLDPENSDIYAANYEEYCNQLAHLDNEYEDAVLGATAETLLFADRFPFLYMTTDYGIEYVAAFTGCSAESEASFETIISLSEELEHHDLPAIIILEGSKSKLADTVNSTAESEDVPVLTLNSMQSVKSSDIEKGTTYIKIMEDNLEIIQEALGASCTHTDELADSHHHPHN